MRHPSRSARAGLTRTAPPSPFRSGSLATCYRGRVKADKQPQRDPFRLRSLTHAPLQAVTGQLGASPQPACACSLCSFATLTRSPPCGLCYARPFAYGSLLACCLRAPMRSRFARFVAALRSRSVQICFCPPLRLVGVALSRGPPPRSHGLSAFAPADAFAALLRPFGALPPSGAIRGLRPRGLRYAPPEYLSSVRGGLPIQSARRGAVALTADCLGNLPPRPIVLTSTCARATPLRLMCATRTR